MPFALLATFFSGRQSRVIHLISRLRSISLSFFSPSMLFNAMQLWRKTSPFLTSLTAIVNWTRALSLFLVIKDKLITVESLHLHRFFNIASKNANALQRCQLHYRLLDMTPPSTPLPAGNFFRAAHAALLIFHAREKLPVVVSGTMMYVNWLIRGRATTLPAMADAMECTRR